MTARQRRQQREFLGGEIETLGVAPRATTEQIDLQIADRDLHRILAAASQRDCLQACQQFDERKRLDQIVVGTFTQTLDAIIDANTRSEEHTSELQALMRNTHAVCYC